MLEHGDNAFLNRPIHAFGDSVLLRQVHPNRDSDDSVQLLLLVCLIYFWSNLILNGIDLTLDYKIVMHLLLPEVEV